ncbi:MAG: NAD(P)/FAD-dependent oxidoreductase [Candidatus Velthaea sp.]
MIDVAIAGGGPAGAATALQLARAGFAVTLVERAAFPRRKVCGEYQNTGAVDALDRLGLRARAFAAGMPLRGIRLVPPRAAAVELPFSRGALACDRATLDAIVLEAARAAGVNIVRGRVEDVLHDGDRVTGLVYRDRSGVAERVPARFVVGADGSGSLVARKLGLTLPLRGVRRFAVGGHYAGFGDLNGFVEMYVGAGAYFAINPLGPDRANVMVVVPHDALARWSGDVDEGLRGKAAELGHGHRSFAGAVRVGERVSVGPLAHRVRTPVVRGALLVGDAAGFLNPFTGQGVYLALSGAEAASAVIGRALHDRSAEGAAFAEYAHERSGDLRTRKQLSALVSLLIDVPPLARRAVAQLQRLPHVGAALMDALAGARSPQSAFRPAVLGRLLL